MNETTVLLTVGDLELTAYSLILTLGALLAIVLTAFLGRKKLGVSSTLSLCLAVIFGAVIGARVVYCATMIESILVDFGEGWSFVFKLWEGGFTLYGAIWGGLIAAALYAHATHRKIGKVLDLLAPGSALVLCCARAAEYFTSQGLGDYIEDEAMQVFPFAVESCYGSWQMPVFFYEAVAAAVILVVVLISLGKSKEDGRTAQLFLVLMSLTQIILESWREDEFIRFGFVRWNQIAAALVLLAVLILRLKKTAHDKNRRVWSIVRTALFVLGAGMIILIEFALDKSSINNNLLYAVMAGTLVVMGVSLLRD